MLGNDAIIIRVRWVINFFTSLEVSGLSKVSIFRVCEFNTIGQTQVGALGAVLGAKRHLGKVASALALRINKASISLPFIFTQHT